MVPVSFSVEVALLSPDRGLLATRCVVPASDVTPARWVADWSKWSIILASSCETMEASSSLALSVVS